MDLVDDNGQKLKQIFPEVFSEGKIDFKKLRQELGEHIDKNPRGERYNTTWNGKNMDRIQAHAPSTGTLRPCQEQSKDWNTTQNLYIESDNNLEVLKLLQKGQDDKRQDSKMHTIPDKHIAYG